MSETLEVVFEDLTRGKRFTEQNMGENYEIPLLTAQLCTVQVKFQGTLIAQGSSATNTRVQHQFYKNQKMVIIIKETKGEKNTVRITFGGADWYGWANWGIITGTSGMSFNLGTGAGAFPGGELEDGMD